jgi:hypothetical protein
VRPVCGLKDPGGELATGAMLGSNLVSQREEQMKEAPCGQLTYRGT